MDFHRWRVVGRLHRFFVVLIFFAGLWAGLTLPSPAVPDILRLVTPCSNFLSGVARRAPVRGGAVNCLIMAGAMVGGRRPDPSPR